MKVIYRTLENQEPIKLNDFTVFQDNGYVKYSHYQGHRNTQEETFELLDIIKKLENLVKMGSLVHYQVDEIVSNIIRKLEEL